MKMRKLVLLGAAVLTAVCSLGLPANASTYDVSFSFSGYQDATPDFQPPGGTNLGTINVTGTMVTTCDSCTLGVGNITSWSFSWNGGSVPGNAGTASGTSGGIAFTNNLSASGGVISFISVASGSASNFHQLPAQVNFGVFQTGIIGCGNAFNNCIELTNASGANIVGTVTLPFAIATEEVVTTTPLPAALPLFATGIGGLGLLGWRRKRKAQAGA
jgi:hypothetical protein